MPLVISDQVIRTTSEGFLVDRTDWNPAVACAIAEAHSIELSDAHWEIVTLIQTWCDAGNEPPSMRELVAETGRRLGKPKARSIYLMKLFGPSPAKMAARLAGVPRPKNCL